MLVRVIDFESTGFPPDAAVCEAGWSDVWITDEETSVSPPVSRLCNPGRAIPPQAMAVHHITNADVEGKPAPEDVLAEMASGATVFAAHKASFEQSFFSPTSALWICTWKVAIRLAPRAPGHTNQLLRYWLALDLDPALASPPHRAGPDAFVTAHLLARMSKKMSVDEMISISDKPAILPYFIFGKHAMKPIEEVPGDYLEWCLRQDMDEDVKHTARHHLKLKQESAAK